MKELSFKYRHPLEDVYPSPGAKDKKPKKKEVQFELKSRKGEEKNTEYIDLHYDTNERTEEDKKIEEENKDGGKQ